MSEKTKTITVSITLRGIPGDFTEDDIKFGLGAWFARLPTSVKPKVNKLKVWKKKGKKS